LSKPPDALQPRPSTSLLFAINDRAKLVLLSFLMLFTELALIRWTGSNVIYLSHFSNFVLLGSFLGIGVGFLRARARGNLFVWAPVMLAFFVFFVLRFQVEIDTSPRDLVYFGKFSKAGLSIWLILPLVFVAVAGIMAAIAEGVARVFATFDPLEAYRLDIMGSIGGIAVFSLLSFVGAPPVGWGLVLGGLFLILQGGRMKLLPGAGLVAVCGLLALESFTPGLTWSPYYKIRYTRVAARIVDIRVNGIPHQSINAVDDLRREQPFYFLAYRRTPNNPHSDVLVVGAGTGNDVAIALSEGAKHVDAVEIDPRIYALGKAMHPDHPYDDPRVHVFIDDGRAFLNRTSRRYDLILFALPDSHTLIAGQSSLRLENYLFTLEGMQSARGHLKPHGAFSMDNFYKRDWLVDRFARTLELAYGHSPCIDGTGKAGRLAVLTVGLEARDVACDRTWKAVVRPVPGPATDDHPFPYLENRSIPASYLLTIGLILLASLITVRTMAGPIRPMAGYVDLFFMGAAFLLLETKNVVQFALLFGTTWFVNALVFAGILVSVFLAIEVARRIRLTPVWSYSGLFAALALAWVIPPNDLLGLAPIPRFLAATGIAFAPVFLANLVFADRFRDVGSPLTAFSANLLGAMVGGLLEYASLVIGYRQLLPVTALLYGCALLFGRWHMSDVIGRDGSRDVESALQSV
jgi:Spermine/spermidine synthase domain